MPGEIVVLLRATGDIEVFERALQLRGLRTLATVGTFWGRQQIGDLHGYLRALANPRDEEALYSALASPLVGCSRDGLALLAEAASDSAGGVWETALARVRAVVLAAGDPDRRAVARFCAWLERERRDGPRRAHLRADRAGGRRTAATARTCSHSTGASAGWPTSTSCCVWRAASKPGKGATCGRSWTTSNTSNAAEAIEPEAPVEGVEPDAVRLMTVHAAKGLEFPVVCVADLGRQPLLRSPKLLVDGERVGLRLRAWAAARCARRSSSSSCAPSGAGARPRRRIGCCTWR